VLVQCGGPQFCWRDFERRSFVGEVVKGDERLLLKMSTQTFPVRIYFSNWFDG
jgi:hypothetical protein